MNNTYRITFIHSENLSYRTIIEATTEQKALAIAFEKLNNNEPFIFENKTHKIFAPIKENIVFLEAELLKKVTDNFTDLVNLLESPEITENHIQKTFDLTKHDNIAAAFKNHPDYFVSKYQKLFIENIFSDIKFSLENKFYSNDEINESINFISSTLKRISKK